MNYKFFGILILILALGCNNLNDNKNLNANLNKASIISVLIDELTISFPPPPIENSTVPLKPLNLDSLNAVKVVVILDTVFESYSKTTKIKSEFKDFQNLVIVIELRTSYRQKPIISL